MSHEPKIPLSPAAPAAAWVAHATRDAMALRWSMLVCVLLLAACGPIRPTSPKVEFVIVRHAEKASDDPRDPQLSAAGMARAQRLAASLATAPLAAIYATAYRRTRQTATPAAAAHSLTVSTYEAKSDAGEFAATLSQRHARGTVLVVGHSNTVPAIAGALCGCTVAPIGDDEYDRRLRVQIDGDGKATLSDTHVP